MNYKILIIGPQGSGKGTQARILSEHFDLPVFSTGNILRNKIEAGDEIGKKVEGLMNSGILAPDDLVNQIIAEKIEKDGGRGYILDGYPRNVAQSRFLDGVDELTYVFEIDISDKEALRRITGRRTCPKCQIVYHLDYNPPKRQGKCDKCDEELVVRDDEKRETVEKRLAIYHSTIKSIIGFYKDKKIYHLIDGEQPIKDVTRNILKVLN
ncbi:MAG: nucleoside monophosphate kinase [Candidatus Kuenenbacteria bacterium]